MGSSYILEKLITTQTEEMIKRERERERMITMTNVIKLHSDVSKLVRLLVAGKLNLIL